MKRKCPPVKSVYKIVESPATRAEYDAYKYVSFVAAYYPPIIVVCFAGTNMAMSVFGTMAPHASVISGRLVINTHAGRNSVQLAAFSGHHSK